MGQILPGITVSFENPKGGVGKSTLTALFAGYVKSLSENSEGLSIAVVDIDDMQNTIGRMRDNEAEEGADKSSEYEVINIGSSEFINQLDFLKENFDIILKRAELGLKTTVRGVMNRVMPNVLEFKEIMKTKDALPFELLNNYVKDSRVDFQRNVTTLMKKYQHPCDAFCEEVLELISNHLES